MTQLQVLSIHGHEVSYRTAGSGPPLLLIHGMAGSSETWEPVVQPLARTFTVIAPDLLGHGESGKPRADYSLGAFASLLRDLLLALGHDRATVVGQSLGGGIAMQFAYQFPDRCERLVLVGSGGLGEEVNPLLRLLTLPGSEYVLPLACNNTVNGIGEKLGSWIGRLGIRPNPAIAEILRSFESLGDAETRRAFIHTLRSVVDFRGQRVSATDKLYLASDVPTLIVWGDRDPIIPLGHAVEAHESIPGSRLEVFEGAGHYPHCTDPERFAHLLEDFVTTTPGAEVSHDRWRERLTTG